MQTITLAVLGLGKQTTEYYISELNQQYHAHNGGYSTCPFLLLNTDFNDINQLLPDTSKALDEIVLAYLESLQGLQSKNLALSHILVPNITLHSTIDRLISKLDSKLGSGSGTKLYKKSKIIHPVDLCIDKLKKEGIASVVLFGSAYTMQSSYMHNKFAKSHIEVLVPNTTEQTFLDSFRKTVYEGQENDQDIQQYHAIINSYTSTSPIVLACTELSIYNTGYNLEQKNIFDMVDIQIHTAVNLLL